ncbi:putative low-complexity protein [Xenococcus sp. PCC 7305]|uniref:pentapeptide repeat-containing protein n=1 Tax=Xenococcus sp. PCC 7305 TaxID=102125 RepID=UPI0002AC5802|nr:pentapeptide repeat-containing protein [Xenococcus sp. PCC 7305]ELS00383.1 putative low-complexity protein [Xenococcus sp. PCC 7305]
MHPNNNISVLEFCQQYSSGKRQFPKARLQKADLRDNSLRNVDLREADLSYTNFKNVDLSDADLRASSLIRAELSGANLSRTNLSGTDLSRANLATAQLIESNLFGSCLNKACLTAAKLVKVNLGYANLTGTYLIGVNLSEANLVGAIYDNETIFPPNFDPVNAGMLQDQTIEQLLAQFNHICQYSNRYLGNIMTAKYLHSSRPNFDWLEQFQISKSNQISFEGVMEDSISQTQLLWFYKWIQSFIDLCSQIVKDFAKLIV